MAVVTSRPLQVVAVLALALLGGCEPSSSPSGRPGSPAAPGTAAPESHGAVEAPALPAAVPFDVGAIKTAAEYLQDPELMGADLARGELLSLACAACHTFRAGQKAIVGPNLHGVFGRPAAAVADFGYSPALRAANLVWTPRALEAWLADPARFVAGTTMTFTGYRSPADRRDLIAYLLHATE